MLNNIICINLTLLIVWVLNRRMSVLDSFARIKTDSRIRFLIKYIVLSSSNPKKLYIWNEFTTMDNTNYLIN